MPQPELESSALSVQQPASIAVPASPVNTTGMAVAQPATQAWAQPQQVPVSLAAPANASKQSEGSSNEQVRLDKLFDQFIDGQSESEDACHAQLFEAKHQLNQLHALVMELAHQVNSTEAAIIAYDLDLEEKLQELQDLETWKDDELLKCKEKKEQAIKMFAQLSNEMEEMHQIASPSVSMNISSGEFAKKLSLLQLSP